MKISGPGLQISTSLGGQLPFVPVQTAPHPMSVLLFGKRPPKRIDARRYPSLKKALRKLKAIAGQVAELVGKDEDDFPVALCEGDNAAISQESELFVGVDLLQGHERDSDLLLGIAGHEVGHRPWTWSRDAAKGLNRTQLNALYREEEAKADRFAGRALADLGASPDPLCAFLEAYERFEGAQSAEYYPVPVRIRMIREAHARRMRERKLRRNIMGISGRESRDLR